MSPSIITELIIGFITILATWYIGDKNVWGQRLSVLGNIGWWFYIVFFKRWGLIPMEIFLTVIVIRNWIKWEKEK